VDDDRSTEVERERDHGVDEYVSDCNKLPFTGPMDARDRLWCGGILLASALAAIVTLALIAGGLYLVYRLVLSLFQWIAGQAPA
jgi:hypothetical protein